ncbi:flagellar assembly protein A [Clostridium lacusfryxellense]|uniref:flagellar assembly protein A n=1 Tax=Clostridium lacusfryxellense TaxID=205328 RepID=UPI001C0B3C30|nr:flagellar assembly protein A [Clostridium lacusfryxellense]MBU3111746.1 DUF342 domain-containing protein [Clostridium lacusfryxellense]
MTGKMFTKKFEGANVLECIRSASTSLGIPAEDIKYLILEEKKGLFKKHAVISVDVIEDLNDKNSDIELQMEILNESNGTIEVRDGKIIIVDPKEGGKPAIISTPGNITLSIDGEKVSSSAAVFEKSVIEISLSEDEAKREMDLRTSPDKMEAYISITYTPKVIYKLKDTLTTNSILLAVDEKEKIMPPKFTELEIKNELLKHNIKYGILQMNIMKCAKTYDVPETLIAKGKRNKDSIDDIMDIKYETQTDKNHSDYEDEQAIDYKAIGTVDGVEEGQVLAILHPGENGEDGIDIAGSKIVTKVAKRILLCVGEGCRLEDKFKVIATSEGRPSSKGSTFFVYKTHKIEGDVELKTGNIQFVGDIVVNGSVREGMKVEAGNSILISKNVAEAEIIASGDIIIKGNVIKSNISAGKEDVVTLEYLEDLNSLKNDISKLIASISQLKELNVIGNSTSDGELVKILLETKYKKIPISSTKVAKRILLEGDSQDELLFIIKNKILNVGTLNIDRYEELDDVTTLIDNKISTLDRNLTLPVDVVLDYCQDSVVKSSGNIIFTGKGEYVSHLVASDSIIFQKPQSLARGGIIKAVKEIKCKIVGGHGGVSTKLIVENDGQIWAEVAYQNTRFIVGEKEYILDVPSKNVHVYLDDARELVVEKLQL